MLPSNIKMISIDSFPDLFISMRHFALQIKLNKMDAEQVVEGRNWQSIVSATFTKLSMQNLRGLFENESCVSNWKFCLVYHLINPRLQKFDDQTICFSQKRACKKTAREPSMRWTMKRALYEALVNNKLQAFTLQAHILKALNIYLPTSVL